jgi:hypothetical protein
MIDFPNSPILNEEFTSGNHTWKWSGEVWNILSSDIIQVTLEEYNNLGENINLNTLYIIVG